MKRNKSFAKRRVGLTGSFTLIEMLVVIAIIGVLASMLMGAINNALSSGRLSACGSNLRQIGIALVMYSDNNDGNGPLATNAPQWDAVGQQSWMQQIFSLVSDKNLYKCPDNDKTDYAYYLGSRAAWVHAKPHGFAPVRRNLIQKPTIFVAGGDVPKGQISPGTSATQFDPLDADKDDYTQKVIGNDLHNGSQNFLFADNHAKAMMEYEPNAMTYRYQTVSDWDLQTGEN